MLRNTKYLPQIHYALILLYSNVIVLKHLNNPFSLFLFMTGPVSLFGKYWIKTGTNILSKSY